MNTFYAICSKASFLYYKIFFKLELIGRENIDRNQNYIICGNHSSLHDPFLLGGVLPLQAHFMSKKENFKYKIVGWVLKKVWVFPVDRDGNDIKAIKTALTILNKKDNLALFPEGTRNKGVEPLPVKSGVALFAVRTKTPILPVTIDSNFKLFSRVRVIFHEPVVLEAYYNQKVASETLERLSQEIMDGIYKSIENVKLENL
ncbi:lysophospholipid acyltransferase family protein [Fusibacter ferrireducens]|uniref:1-acyl-sn-glycerol-3-phosphate acyltransferase n=1 Tax=Fusibacter ferrireducens TaxID=2785058 RepID=A0ABR9ZT83_9FIRM|nr:lysophospholipid acyltransferase family protein [Fusibacter ferrireducens]MBF4693657.1 1-acyl-sn-glycerol-3-phosphate acyltransferase [Fusibacter ferrireducens]